MVDALDRPSTVLRERLDTLEADGVTWEKIFEDCGQIATQMQTKKAIETPKTVVALAERFGHA